MPVKAIADYPELMRACEGRNEIVYLCGAGASMALGNHVLSWPRWILAGKAFLSAEEQDELDRAMGAWSTSELINAAGYLLKTLKGKNQYRPFMDATIGCLCPANAELARALNNIWRSGDRIATTNYDLLIEAAIKADSVTHQSPGQILSVLSNKAENRVIHLHGAYDPTHGVDDIIADNAQYDAILSNAGAQFIQQLLGTRTIIIVGCGGTVEDPNLSGFMSFIVDKLGVSDVPYFYLMREDDGVPNLPPNAVPVFYGDEYGDLPAFMEELAICRLKNRLNLKRFVSVNPYIARKMATSAFGRMHFSNRFSAFVGRTSEFNRLNAFAESGDSTAWWVVCGEGGSGKSRLVLEWLSRLPAHWFGCFARKDADAARDFVPFTDTVIVFDYILGEESKVGETVEALLDRFSGSLFKLRILFIERRCNHADGDWLTELKRFCTPAGRLELEASEYDEPALSVSALSRADESKYIAAYLKAFLPLLPDDSFVDKCRASIADTGAAIQKAYRESVDSACYRPLFLNIFIEVWISKGGVLAFSGAKELLREFIGKEMRRWEAVLGDRDIVNSYVRCLAVACAIERFNLTDVNGENYLEGDCQRLIGFCDDKSAIPGHGNSFEDLFISMDECIDTGDEPNPIMEAFYNPQPDREGHEHETFMAKLDEDERFEFFTPYIKLDADPDEVYLNLLEGAGVATGEELARREEVRRRRIEKYERMPDHAWIIEPLFPDIIRAYIVAYAINSRDYHRFARLTRANSILEFYGFLTRAMEDWPNEPIFETMLVTPPREILNHFEYYAGLMMNLRSIEDYSEIEKYMISTEATRCYQRLELELWRRIAVVITERDKVAGLYESAMRFFEYIDQIEGNVRDEINGALEAYAVGLYNSADLKLFKAFMERCEGVLAELPENDGLGRLCCENRAHMMRLKLYHKKDSEIEEDWATIEGFLEQYPDDEALCQTAMPAAKDYLDWIRQCGDLDKIAELEQFLEKVYRKHGIAEVADILATTAANRYGIAHQTRGEKLPQEYEKIKHCLNDYPKSKAVRLAYAVTSDLNYDAPIPVQDVPRKIIAKAEAWSRQYPDEIQFQEAYFGLLFTHFRHTCFTGESKERRRTLQKMEELARNADYSQYNEPNALMASLEMIKNLHTIS